MALINLNEKEQKLVNNFKNIHKQCVEKHPLTSGGHFEYIITPTGIGTICKIKCNICNEIQDITDYDCW
jgi:hypothetical protein